MDDGSQLDPRHDDTRQVLRTVGPVVAGVGLLFVAIGMISFFSAFGSFSPPRYFWCAFVGMPLLAIGIGITKFAYLGSIARYLMGETAPVGKDAFNYMARGTGPAAGEFAREVARGVSEGLDAGQRAFCTQCGAGTDSGDQFCRRCGVRLARAEGA